MKLVTFSQNGKSRLGAVLGNEVVDTIGQRKIPQTMLEFLAAGEQHQAAMQKLIESGKNRIPVVNVKFEAPVQRPSKYLAVGLNYADHIEETGREKPEFPTIFSKQVACIVGPGEGIHMPRVSDKLDYEGELAFIIGKQCRYVPKERASEVIAGYTIANDVTVRDWQARSATWTMGKSFDTHGPIGPWIITSDEIGDPHDLDIKTWVNADLRQSMNTNQMLFNCYELVEYITTAMTLEPGDIISTGTGSGVGVMMEPKSYMKVGDSVKIQIDKIGTLINSVIDEPEDVAII